jgi:hypothetical protein
MDATARRPYGPLVGNILNTVVYHHLTVVVCTSHILDKTRVTVRNSISYLSATFKFITISIDTLLD